MRKNKLYGDQDGATPGCSCSCPLTGDLTSSACVCGCVVNGVNATAATLVYSDVDQVLPLNFARCTEDTLGYVGVGMGLGWGGLVRAQLDML